MSNAFSTLITTLESEIPTISGFSAKKQLPNPYDLESNGTQYLRDGWGITIGGGSIGPGELHTVLIDQDFDVVLTRGVAGQETSATQIMDAIKSAKTDAQNAIRHLHSNVLVSKPDGIVDVSFVSTDAIEYNTTNDEYRFISLAITFTARINEDL